jgi:YCII-related domain
MANYVFAYKGGSMAATDAEREAAMAAWGNWFGSLGQAVVEVGNPFGASTSVSANGSSGQAGSLSGYSVIAADDLAAAAELAKGSPVIAGGGSVEVYETIQVM